jgi:ketosteroid isomerase-like protein
MDIKITAQQLAEKMQQVFRNGDLSMHAALYAEDAIYYEASQKGPRA